VLFLGHDCFLTYYEGEFANLREAVDVLLVGASGELPANPRHAALLAPRLLEYKVSAVSSNAGAS
jgi:hypothetical protein